MMLSDKNANTHKRVSLLSRASNSYAYKKEGRPSIAQQNQQKNYDRSSKLLNLYLQPQMTSNRDSCFYIEGIDERPEFDLTHDSGTPDRRNHQKSSRPSEVSKNYNFDKHYTPG